MNLMAPRRPLRPTLTAERGSQTLGFAALLPLVVMTIVLIWQFALAAYSVVVAHAAARDAARAAAVGNDWRTAAERAAAGLIIDVADPDFTSLASGRAVTVRVRVRVPLMPLPFLRNRQLFAETAATMPEG